VFAVYQRDEESSEGDFCRLARGIRWGAVLSLVLWGLILAALFAVI
jgi:hypothetical protein